MSSVCNSLFEKLMHPILNVLDKTEHEWLKHLLLTFNSGDIGKFESLAVHFNKQVRSLSINLHIFSLFPM
jgi:hypothetical protein